MITIKNFTFNLFSTNTFILSDETGECIIIDPANSKPSEDEQITEYISSKRLKPVAQIITHYHIDHILGIGYVRDTYGLEATAHPAGSIFWSNPDKYRFDYGIDIKEIVAPTILVNENDIIRFGKSALKVIYVPGHADGSICLINEAQRFLIAGDVLFYGSIGRTDLPTGSFDILHENILEKLFTLDDNYTVYPGHGPKTNIGMERLHNPFIN